MEKLFDLINISFLKLLSSPYDTVTKVGWFFVSKEIKNTIKMNIIVIELKPKLTLGQL